jgi:hypothetical protein
VELLTFSSEFSVWPSGGDRQLHELGFPDDSISVRWVILRFVPFFLALVLVCMSLFGEVEEEEVEVVELVSESCATVSGSSMRQCREKAKERGNEELLYWFSLGFCGVNGGFYEEKQR